MHPERITKADKNMVNNLDYEGIKEQQKQIKTWLMILIMKALNLMYLKKNWQD